MAGFTAAGCSSAAATQQVDTAAPSAAATLSEPTEILTPAFVQQPSPAVPARILASNASWLEIDGSTQLDNVYRLRWSSDGTVLGAMTPDGLQLLDAQTLVPAANIEVKPPYVLLDFSPDQNWMAVSSDQQFVELRNILSDQVVQTIRPDNPIICLVFNTDGSQVATGSTAEIAVTLWDTRSGQRVQSYNGFDTAAPVYRAEFAPGGRALVWIARETVQVMEMASGAFGPQLIHEDSVSAISVRPDMRMLATTSAGMIGDTFSAVIKVWDLAGGTAAATLPAGEIIPPTIEYSPDGSLLATSQGEKVVLWDPARQEKAAVLDGPIAPVYAVAFSPDGTALVAASQDGQIRIWRIKP